MDNLVQLLDGLAEGTPGDYSTLRSDVSIPGDYSTLKSDVPITAGPRVAGPASPASFFSTTPGILVMVGAVALAGFFLVNATSRTSLAGTSRRRRRRSRR